MIKIKFKDLNIILKIGIIGGLLSAFIWIISFIIGTIEAILGF